MPPNQAWQTLALRSRFNIFYRSNVLSPLVHVLLIELKFACFRGDRCGNSTKSDLTFGSNFCFFRVLKEALFKSSQILPYFAYFDLRIYLDSPLWHPPVIFHAIWPRFQCWDIYNRTKSPINMANQHWGSSLFPCDCCILCHFITTPAVLLFLHVWCRCRT